MKYSPQIEIEIQTSLESYRKRKNDIFTKLNKYRGNLIAIGTAAQDTFSDSNLNCSVATDLPYISQYYAAEIHKLNNKIRVGQILCDIFTAIKSEEALIIERLLTDTQAAEFFAQITDHKYVDLNYAHKSGKISVQSKDGVWSEISHLSSATKDQLYFCLRMALAMKYLDDGTAFFVLDEAFVKSDLSRLHKQLDLLLHLSDLGWQIFYFSAKQEVLDYLHMNPKVKLFEIQK